MRNYFLLLTLLFILIPIGCSQDTETSTDEKEVNESENKEDDDIQKRIDYLRDGLKEAQVLYDNGHLEDAWDALPAAIDPPANEEQEKLINEVNVLREQIDEELAAEIRAENDAMIQQHNEQQQTQQALDNFIATREAEREAEETEKQTILQNAFTTEITSFEVSEYDDNDYNYEFTVKNNSDIDFSSLTLKVTLVDGEGNNITSEENAIFDLYAGETKIDKRMITSPSADVSSIVIVPVDLHFK